MREDAEHLAQRRCGLRLHVGYPAITLKDAQGGAVGVLVDEAFDVRALPVS